MWLFKHPESCLGLPVGNTSMYMYVLHPCPPRAYKQSSSANNLPSAGMIHTISTYVFNFNTNIPKQLAQYIQFKFICYKMYMSQPCASQASLTVRYEKGLRAVYPAP